MANILFMGFEHLIATYHAHANVWDITQPGFLVSTSLVRPGGSLQKISNTSGAETFGVKSLGANYSHLFAGFGYINTRSPLPSMTNCLFTFYDGATPQVGIRVLSDGSIGVYAGDTTAATLLGQTAAGVITTGAVAADYKMIEIEVTFHATTGSVVLKVADTQVLSLTNKNTAPSGTAQANRFKLRCSTNNNGPESIDDLYINDDTGSAPENTFFGEAFVVEGIIATGNGNSSQWVGSDGNSTDNYLLVDDTGNNDTDYIKSGTLNDLDLHSLGNLTNATGTVIGLNHYIVARKDDVATRTIASTIRTASTNYVGANKTMTGSYATFIENRLINPNTSLRFTISDVNGLEAGEKVTT